MKAMSISSLVISSLGYPAWPARGLGSSSPRGCDGRSPRSSASRIWNSRMMSARVIAPSGRPSSMTGSWSNSWRARMSAASRRLAPGDVVTMPSRPVITSRTFVWPRAPEGTACRSPIVTMPTSCPFAETRTARRLRPRMCSSMSSLIVGELLDAGTGGVLEEEPDGSRPEPAEQVTVEDAKDAPGDEAETNQLTGRCGNFGCTADATRRPPDDRAEDATSVEREAGDQVECAEQDIHDDEIGEDDAGSPVERKASQEQGGASDRETR